MKKLFLSLLVVLISITSFSQTRSSAISAPLIETLANDTHVLTVEENKAKYVLWSTMRGNILNDVITATVQTLDVSAEWTTGLSFDVTARNFPVSQVWYSATSGVVTLDAAHGTYDRIDLIVANKDGTVGKVTGDPSAAPAEPDYDASEVYPIKFVMVKTGAVIPTNPTTGTTFATQLVYNENLGPPTEWTTTVTSNLNKISTTAFYNGTMSIEATTTTLSDKSTFIATAPLSVSELSSLTFWIKLKAPLGSSYIFIKFWNDNVQLGRSYLFNHGKNGLDGNSLAWQKIVLDKGLFNLPTGSTYDKIQIYPFKSGYSGYFLDLVSISDGSLINPLPTDPNTSEITKTSQLTNDGADGINPFIVAGDVPLYTLSAIDGSNNFSLLKNGVAVNTLDLTPYLDDTNTYLTSGTLNSTTGILTVTRNDASTFTIDLSGLIDVQPTSTSQLTNNGANGTNPFITALDVTPHPTATSSFTNDGEVLAGNDRFVLESEISGLIPIQQTDKETVLISGDVIWKYGLTFYVYADKYKINGILREGLISATVTLSAADVTNGRIDSFVIQNDGLGDAIGNDSIIVVPGDPSPDPVKQVLDNGTQLEVSFAVIDANATEPTSVGGLSTEIVYAEGGEWTITGGNASINTASTSLPLDGTISILSTNTAHNTSLYFSTGSPLFTDSQSVLQLDIKLNNTWPIQNTNGTTIDVYLWKGNNRFTNRIRIGSDLGLSFNNYNITTTQTVYIRLDRFPGIFNSNTYDKIQLQWVRTDSKILRVDNIKIVKGFGGVTQTAVVVPTKTSQLINDGNGDISYPFITAQDIPATSVPTLQAVTDVGAVTTNDVTVNNLQITQVTNPITPIYQVVKAYTGVASGGPPIMNGMQLPIDSDGNMYLTGFGSGSNRVDIISTQGVVTTLNIGTGEIRGIALDPTNDDLYILSRTNGVVTKRTKLGVVTTLSTIGIEGLGMIRDNVNNITYVAVIPAVAEIDLYKITSTGTTTLFVGTGLSQYYSSVYGIDLSGNLYTRPPGAGVLKITPAGVVSTIALPGATAFNEISFACDTAGDGSMYIGNGYAAGEIYKITPAGVGSIWYNTATDIGFSNISIANGKIYTSADVYYSGMWVIDIATGLKEQEFETSPSGNLTFNPVDGNLYFIRNADGTAPNLVRITTPAVKLLTVNELGDVMKSDDVQVSNGIVSTPNALITGIVGNKDLVTKEYGDVNYIDGSGLASVVAGTNVTVDNTDPLNPIVSASVGINTLQQVIEAGSYIEFDGGNSSGEVMGGTANNRITWFDHASGTQSGGFEASPTRFNAQHFLNNIGVGKLRLENGEVLLSRSNYSVSPVKNSVVKIGYPTNNTNFIFPIKGADGDYTIATLDDITGGTAPTGLEAINEGSGIGWRLIGTDPLNYGTVGQYGVDLSRSGAASSVFGATGYASGAFGFSNIASGAYSFVSGERNQALSPKAVAFGSFNIINGDTSGAFSGSYNQINGQRSASLGGFTNTIDGDKSVSLGGDDLTLKSLNEVGLGRWNTLYTPVGGADINNTGDRLLIIGNGTSSVSRSDQFTILKNGKVGIDIDNFETTTKSEILQINGSVNITGQYNLSTMNTAPSSATDTGVLGEIRVTATYIYVCTATNTWVRAALATW